MCAMHKDNKYRELSQGQSAMGKYVLVERVLDEFVKDMKPKAILNYTLNFPPPPI